jgi:hypothetical protein
MSDIFIAFVLNKWRVIAWDNLIASCDTEEEASVVAKQIKQDPKPLRSYLGLKD